MGETVATPLGALLGKAQQSGGAVLLPYMTAGLPGPDTSLDMFRAMADAGADGFEVGIPYSDPLMDGPTIHEAGLRALDLRDVPAGRVRFAEDPSSAELGVQMAKLHHPE